jgi:putative adenylate-forming enzyme
MNILRAVTSFARSRRLMKRFRARTELDAWHHDRVMEHLAWVRERSPYYRRLFDGLDACQWRTWPTSDKRVMVEDFDDANTGGLRRDELMPLATLAERSRDFSGRARGFSVGLSSGTSGRRSLFVSSPTENDRWAGAVLARVLRRPIASCRRIAFFHRANNTLYSHANIGPMQVRFFDLLKPIPDLLEAATAYQPTMLVGPPAMLRELADAQSNGRVRLSPGRIISVAEQLDPLDRSFIERAFGVTLDQLYIATEGFIAATCAHGRLHLCEELLVVQEEPVPGDARRFVPILTDFSRRTQPIIRYRLNDILVRGRDDACPCGSIFRSIDRIEGRCDDQFVLPSTSSGAPDVIVFPDFIREACTSSQAVEAFQACQTSTDRVVVRLSTHVEAQRAAREAVRDALMRLFARLQAEPPSIEFDAYHVDLSKGKLRRVERAFRWPERGE